MDLQYLTNILLALAVTHTLHSFGEVRNIREKVKRLNAYITKSPYKEIPIKIDTRLKGIGIGYALVVILFLITWSIVGLLDPGVQTALWLSIGLLVIGELVNTVTIDAYHAEIESVTQRFKKK